MNRKKQKRPSKKGENIDVRIKYVDQGRNTQKLKGPLIRAFFILVKFSLDTKIMVVSALCILLLFERIPIQFHSQ